LYSFQPFLFKQRNWCLLSLKETDIKSCAFFEKMRRTNTHRKGHSVLKLKGQLRETRTIGKAKGPEQQLQWGEGCVGALDLQGVLLHIHRRVA
jgi:hypothetical protein